MDKKSISLENTNKTIYMELEAILKTKNYQSWLVAVNVVQLEFSLNHKQYKAANVDVSMPVFAWLVMANIKNIPLRKFRKWLYAQGCKDIRTSGGHEIWSRSDLMRPLTLQTHIDPVPPRIIKQFLTYLEVEVNDFLQQVDNL